MNMSFETALNRINTVYVNIFFSKDNKLLKSTIALKGANSINLRPNTVIPYITSRDILVMEKGVLT